MQIFDQMLLHNFLFFNRAIETRKYNKDTLNPYIRFLVTVQFSIGSIFVTAVSDECFGTVLLGGWRVMGSFLSVDSVGKF